MTRKGDTCCASVNFINSETTKHKPAIKLEVCVTEATTLLDFMQTYFPKLNETNTQVAFGNSAMVFVSWQHLSLKACVELFSAQINIRTGFEFRDNPQQSRQRQMKGGNISMLTLHMFIVKFIVSTQQVYCEDCEKYSEVYLLIGIYRVSQLKDTCDFCKKLLKVIRICMNNIAIGSGFHSKLEYEYEIEKIIV